jgi:hypothetical protein
MGTTLTGTTPQDTYDSLIKVTDNGPLSGTAKYLSDGLGNDSALALSTSSVGIGTNNPLHKLDTRGILSVFNAALDGITAPTLYLGHPSFTTTYLNKISTSVSAAPNSQVMQFSVANGASTYADVMTLNGAGNVGIGTSSPAAKLQTTGTDAASVITGLALENFISTNPASGNGVAVDFRLNNSGNASVVAGKISTVNTFFRSNTDMVFSTFTSDTLTEKARILSSGGITFNGDTAAANALDDYEEGTWTMSVSFDGASVGQTTAQNTGTYTKIGRQVTVNGLVELTNKGTSTGLAAISGLPFPVGSLIANYGAASVYLSNITFLGQFMAFAISSESRIRLRDVSLLGVITDLNEANFANNSTVMVNFTYFV